MYPVGPGNWGHGDMARCVGHAGRLRSHCTGWISARRYMILMGWQCQESKARGRGKLADVYKEVYCYLAKNRQTCSYLMMLWCVSYKQSRLLNRPWPPWTRGFRTCPSLSLDCITSSLFEMWKGLAERWNMETKVSCGFTVFSTGSFNGMKKENLATWDEWKHGNIWSPRSFREKKKNKVVRESGVWWTHTPSIPLGHSCRES